MLISAFGKAFHNLLFPGILRLFLWCLLAYAIGWTVFSVIIGHALAAFTGVMGMEGFLVQAMGTAGGGLIAWLLFPLLYPILVSFFDDYMAEVIETRDYPQLPKAAPPFWPTFAHDALFSLKAVALNLVCLPLYFIPLVGWLLYLAINGYLLGVQFFRMAAGRRVNRERAEELLRRHRGAIVMGGVTVVFSATVPLLNLAAPLLGVATMLHLFHAANGTDKVEILPVI